MKKYTPDQIVAKLRQADVELGKGRTVKEVCRAIEVLTCSPKPPHFRNPSRVARFANRPHCGPGGAQSDLRVLPGGADWACLPAGLGTTQVWACLGLAGVS